MGLGWVVAVWLQAISTVTMDWVWKERFPKATEPAHYVWQVLESATEKGNPNKVYVHLFWITSLKWALGLSAQIPGMPQNWIKLKTPQNAEPLHIFWQYPLWWQSQGMGLLWRYTRWQGAVSLEAWAPQGTVRLDGTYFYPVYWQNSDGTCTWVVDSVDPQTGWAMQGYWQVKDARYDFILIHKEPLPHRWQWPQIHRDNWGIQWETLTACW